MKKSFKKRKQATPGILMAGQAMRLLRQAPFFALAAYMAGTVPFIVAFLWLWADQSYGAYAHTRLAGGALLTSLMFVWMKVWQSIFATSLLAFASDLPQPRWTKRSLMRSILIQGVIQPLGFIMLPVSLILTLPYPSCSAFLQNILVTDSPEASTISDIFRDAKRLAPINTLQNMRIIWLLSPWNICAATILCFGITRIMLGDMSLAFTEFEGIIWFFFTLILFGLQTFLLSPFGSL